MARRLDAKLFKLFSLRSLWKLFGRTKENRMEDYGMGKSRGSGQANGLTAHTLCKCPASSTTFFFKSYEKGLNTIKRSGCT